MCLLLFQQPLIIEFSYFIVCTTQFLNGDKVKVRYKLNVRVLSTANMLITRLYIIVRVLLFSLHVFPSSIYKLLLDTMYSLHRLSTYFSIST